MRRVAWFAAFAVVVGVVLGMTAFGGEAEMAGRIDKAADLGRVLRGQIDRAAQKNVRIIALRSRAPLKQGDIEPRQIVARDFRTAVDVGEIGGPAGIRMTADEIAGYSAGTTKEFGIRSSDGKAEFGGGAGLIDEDGVRVIGELFGTLNGYRLEEPAGTLQGLWALETVSGRVILYAPTKDVEVRPTTTAMVWPASGANVSHRSIKPNATGALDLGEITTRWRVVYTDELRVEDSLFFGDGSSMATAPVSGAVTLDASEDLLAGDVVWITGSGTVGKTLTSIDARKVAGVVIANASSGAPVSVQVAGKITVTANEAIAVGDRVQISTAVAGRVAKLSTFASGAGLLEAPPSRSDSDWLAAYYISGCG